MAQAFSNPYPADDETFLNTGKPVLLRIQITDYTLVDVTLSRFNVNGIWYSETPYGVDTWAAPDRVGKILTGANPGGLRYPVLANDTSYDWYFEVVETGGGGTFTSPTYSFDIGDVPPRKATTPAPAHEATNQVLGLSELSWVDGGDADTYDVYFGLGDGDLELLSEDQAGLTFALTTIETILAYYTGYQWRIDSVNEYGTTTGDVWTFTSMRLSPPLPSGLSVDYSGDDPVLTGTPTGENNMAYKKRLVVATKNKIFYEDL